MIIGLTGKMGSGKSTVHKWFVDNLGADCVGLAKFANPLYEMQDFIYDRIASVYHTPFGIKDRKLLQWLGTEWGRELDPDLWIKLWEYENEEVFKEFEIVIVDDVRFDNEAEAIRNLGGIVLEIQSDKVSDRIDVIQPNHASEQGVDRKYINYLLKNNGTLEEFSILLEGIYNHTIKKE